ncbi:LPP20 family lipoprotein [Halonatronum saccharophilum]|uniref:LPP20 family lipoprotein n=1 Tax=Halonatronum saccharophilum TaxID=150060 RepID=UPI0004836CEF|nr:LPP20 family lipoprotein [Halonatronum saccharophilum]
MFRQRILPLLLILFWVTSIVKADVGSSIFAEKDNGVYDWEKSVVQATGFGISPSFINNSSQGRIMAREAAITTAQRRLLELIDGVQIDSKQTVKNVQIESDVIEKRVSGLLQGARIIEEESIDDKTYMVVMELEFYGNGGVIEAIFPAIEDSRRSTKDSIWIDRNDGFGEEEGEYTSIIIKAPSDLSPALAPKIYNSSGDLIYGVSTIDIDDVITDGLVSYSRSLADARNNSRAGNNPLIIDAQGVKGDYSTDIVISNRDARSIKSAGIRGVFSDRRVIVVLN